MSDVSLPELPVLAADARLCGNCKLWQPHSVDARGWVGPCRLQAERGLFPPTAPVCNHFHPRGQPAGAGPNVVARSTPDRNRAVRNVAPVVIRRNPDGTTSTSQAPGAAAPNPLADPSSEVELEGLNMTRQELIEIIREAAGEGGTPPPLAGKWEGGTIQLIPGKPELQAKELPIDTLFHKIVMVRDRLRTMEQKLNAHPKLSEAEKVELQGYLTRIYGSLTSFNHLFRDKQDYFVGAKGEGGE